MIANWAKGITGTAGVLGTWWAVSQPWAWMIFYVLGCALFSSSVWITYHLRQARVWHGRRSQHADQFKRAPLLQPVWHDNGPGVAAGRTGGNREDDSHATARPGPAMRAEGQRISGGEQQPAGEHSAITGWRA